MTDRKDAKKGAKASKDSGKATLSFDERMAELEVIAGHLEGGDLGLEQALEQYRRGVSMLRECQEELKSVREQVQELAENGSTEPYAGDPDGSSEA